MRTTAIWAVLAAGLTACGDKDPVCGEGYALLNGECVEVLDPVDDTDTVYVEPDTGDTGDVDCACDVCEEGTADAPAFTSIQAAIDAASSGDEVTVCPGTYRELITLSTAVSLTGAGSATTTRIAIVDNAFDLNGLTNQANTI